MLNDSATSDGTVAYASPTETATEAPDSEVPVGLESPVSESPASGRDTAGRFLPGHPGPRLVHGLYSRLVQGAELPEQAETLSRLAERRAAVEADLGGTDALSQISRDLVARYLETSTIAEFLAGVLVANGPLTPRGRARSALNAYLQVLDRQHRLALALGLSRRARPVCPSEALMQEPELS